LGPVDAQPDRHDAVAIAISGIRTRRKLLGMVQRNRIAQVNAGSVIVLAFNW
jgi:hypothetical protein